MLTRLVLRLPPGVTLAKADEQGSLAKAPQPPKPPAPPPPPGAADPFAGARAAGERHDHLTAQVDRMRKGHKDLRYGLPHDHPTNADYTKTWKNARKHLDAAEGTLRRGPQAHDRVDKSLAHATRHMDSLHGHLRQHQPAGYKPPVDPFTGRAAPTFAKAASVRLTLRVPETFAKASGAHLRPTKINRTDGVVQTYHKGARKTPASAPGPATVTPSPAPRAPAPTPTQPQRQAPRPALDTVKPTGPRPGQRPDGLPPKATGASVERAAMPKKSAGIEIPKPLRQSYDHDPAEFAAVHAKGGDAALLEHAKKHITSVFDRHNEHIDHMADRYDVHAARGSAIINMGLPASGKTSAAKMHSLRHGQHLHVDVDNYKHFHPNYDPKEPQHVHGFSKELEAHAFAEAKRTRVPVVLDTTGGNHKKWVDRIKQLRDNGYGHVGLAYAKVDPAEAKRRNLARDRSVPEHIIDSTLAEFDPNHPDNHGKTPFEHFRPHVDKFHVYDHRHESDANGHTPFGKEHAKHDRAAAWKSMTATEEAVRARAKQMGKAFAAGINALADLFMGLPTRYARFGG